MSDQTDATETPAEGVEETGSALVIRVNENPGIVLLDDARADRFVKAVEAEVKAHVPDLTTAKGRAAIKSLAFKVTKTKTAIDDAGKTLKEEAQATVKKVDAARRGIRDRLDAIAAGVRQPLVDWEEAETARIEAGEALVQRLRAAAVIFADETADALQARLDALKAEDLPEDILADRTEEAAALRDTALAALESAVVRVKQAEKDRAELEALRAQAAAREAEEAERQAAITRKKEKYEAEKARLKEEAEAVERRKAYAQKVYDHISDVRGGMIGGRPYPYAVLIRELEEKVTREPDLEHDWERIDAHRLEALNKLKGEQARDQAEAEKKRAEAEAQRIQYAAQEAAAAAQAEAEAKAAKAEADRLAAAKREADEAAARAADREHRGAVMGAAKDALIAGGVPESAAVAAIKLIAGGRVPQVAITF